MANVVDTKLYDILGVPPGASENELKKVPGAAGGGEGARACAAAGRPGRAPGRPASRRRAQAGGRRDETGEPRAARLGLA